MKNIFLQLFLLITLLLGSVSTYADEAFYEKISSIPHDIQLKMFNHTWHEGCPVSFEQLAYLKLSYWGFDNKAHVGELIVYKPLAKETVNIFKQLFAMKFPIEQMRLPDNYANDDAQAAANNTSAFYCRADGQSPKKLSRHSYGVAIDINPLYNPALEGGKVSPENGSRYLDRHVQQKGMINEGDKVFMLFTKAGWLWGGYFPQVDYMHFDKLITRHYFITQMEYTPLENQIKALHDF